MVFAEVEEEGGCSVPAVQLAMWVCIQLIVSFSLPCNKDRMANV